VIHDLRSLARALGGDVSGKTLSAPGPGHTPRDRSLSITLDSNAPDGFLVFSHAGDDWRVCRDYVRQRLGLPAWEPGDERSRTIPPQHIKKWDLAAIESEVGMQPRTEDDLIRIERAVKIWNEADNPRGTVAEQYLASRCLDLPDDLAGSVLRFHSKTPWRDENSGQTIRIPCLLAAFRSFDDDEITAIHRIRADQPERWPKTERRMFGVVRRAAVKLGAPSKTLIIGEGVETSMAARQMEVGDYAWALGSVGAISFFPVLPGIRKLLLLSETGNASAEALKICSRRWRDAYREVNTVIPTEGSDLNDALMADRKIAQ
jgi:putative DNA primase/helicase